MLEYLSQLTDIYLFFLLISITVIISIIGVTLVKYFIPIDTRYQDNVVIGNVSSFVSIIYGVLAGLMALYLINNINYTSDAVQREANAVANLYRDSQWLKEPTKAVIQNEIKNYITNVITVEWPLMEKGKILDDASNLLIDKIANNMRLYPVSNNAEMLVMHDMLEEVKALYNARGLRVHMSYSELNIEIWVVILIGTVLTIMINYFFGIRYRMHLLAVSVAAIMSSSMIFLLLTLDRPFQGEFVIEPLEMKYLLNWISPK